ncbi:serine hydrolase [Mangrovimonas sp. TPBH4]|uniref:serine hydrolase domain-containing protein n=1 Tax=Mangrovimonas sp. TPBH4 TaxID=1645914 RepID=UPI0006B654DA|nr:serine hydrolase [Mangrovimonas sp. TPBH4]
MKSTIFFYFILINFYGFSQSFPNKDWAINKNPSQVGWNPIKMKSFNDFIVDSTKVTGLMIIHKGEVVYQYGNLSQISRVASCRKSILSTLFGKYVENGTIDLNETIGDLKIDDIGGILPIEKKATVQDLLSARSAVFKNTNESIPDTNLPKRGSHEPGTYWLYNNWDFDTYGTIFELKTKNNIYDEVEAQLAIPLNFQDWNRDAQHKVSNPTSNSPMYHMWLSTRDFARIGHLMLNRGNWKGKQLISEYWVDEMLKERTNYKEVNDHVDYFRNSQIDYGYGYSWWLVQNTEDYRFKNAFVAAGAWGNGIVVYPNIETVLAFVTCEVYDRINEPHIRQKIRYKAADIFDPEWEKNYVTTNNIVPISLTENQKKQYLGRYQIGKRPPVTIKNATHGLLVELPNGRNQELIPINGDRFAIKDQYIVENILRTIQFVRDENGNVQGLVLPVVNNKEIKLTKIQ